MKDKQCKICGSVKGIRFHKKKQYLCGKHRQQLYHFGEIRHRTLSSGNDYIDRNTHHEVVIYGRDLKEKGRALIDSKDKEKVQSAGSWCLSNGYASNGTVKTTMHIYLLGKKSGLEIDHINGDKLDNRRSNLRFVKHSVNGQSWVDVYKRKIVRDFKNHLAEGKDVDSYFNNLLN